ncbi:hypothetical protein OEZ86_004666 [Tetradesmus obliquus]|nr:hypothetical protein OEZ86_004666 [Tetradesmus obliquus]
MVMARLASCLEPGGVYGPSLVARDLANASLVCSEFYCAAQFGLSAVNSNIQHSLQQQLLRQPLPPPPSTYLGDKARQAHNTAAALSTGLNLPGPKGWHFWDVLVTEPLSLHSHYL